MQLSRNPFKLFHLSKVYTYEMEIYMANFADSSSDCVLSGQKSNDRKLEKLVKTMLKLRGLRTRL